uniref:ATP synthase F0 subunit 8 n=1 Tax=Turritopsis lata TaxID=1246326 RepID=UPI001C0F392B|nr:ATP synthase F0 subunit 8 [Turritopsis lata]QQW46718.1 ATP synthase F0 subunit 8 [Turritopsis lata]
MSQLDFSIAFGHFFVFIIFIYIFFHLLITFFYSYHYNLKLRQIKEDCDLVVEDSNLEISVVKRILSL